jgi:hypothetical protein
MAYAKQVAKIAERIVIPNWFDRDILMDLTGDSISERKFREFVWYMQDSNIPDEVSEMVRELWCEFKGGE